MSDILKSVHKTAKGLKNSGVIDKTTMRKFDALCLTTVHELSQPVFAQYLNVSDKLVKKWEQGDSKPRGAALKMLSIAEKKGLEVIA